MTSIDRRQLLIGSAAGALAAAVGPARAQAFPTRPVRIVVPFSAGGGSDILARNVGIKLTERLGQQIVVEP